MMFVGRAMTVTTNKAWSYPGPFLVSCSSPRLLDDARHEKTDLKVFVVIPKGGLAGGSPANPSLDMAPTIKYHSTAFIDYIL